MFTEADYSDKGAGWKTIHPYPKSKTLAERAAWSAIEAQPAGRGLELSVIVPGVIYGPTLTPAISSTLEIASRLLNHEMPLVPDILRRARLHPTTAH